MIYKKKFLREKKDTLLLQYVYEFQWKVILFIQQSK